MNKADLQCMFDAHYWAHRRVWDCIMKLTDEQFERDLDYSQGSIHKQCVHTMIVEWMWLSVVRDPHPPQREQFPDPEQFTNRDSIRNWWGMTSKPKRTITCAW